MNLVRADLLHGLSSAEAARRLAETGPNVLPEPPRRGALHLALATLRQPLFLLLVGAAALYPLLGDLGEGLFLVFGAAVSVVSSSSRRPRANARSPPCAGWRSPWPASCATEPSGACPPATWLRAT